MERSEGDGWMTTINGDVSFLQAGGGAVPRPLLDKVQERVSVMDFIPVPEHARIRARTSTYDCLPAIKAAIAAVGPYGGKVYFPPGLYKVSDTVVVDHDNITLAGAGGHARSRQGLAAIRASAATSIMWAGAATPPEKTAVVCFQAPVGGSGLYGGGVYNLGIDGHMQAPIGLKLASANAGRYSQVTVFAVTEAAYDLSAVRHELSNGVGATQFNLFELCGSINHVYNGGSGPYHDNTAKGWQLRQDSTIAANTGDPSENTFIRCWGITSRGPFVWIESVGQNTFISTQGGARHPSGPEGGYNCVLCSEDQDSNPGIALHGTDPGVARYSVFLYCEMSIVAKASNDPKGGGAFGIQVIGKSMGNVSPAPLVEKGAPGSKPANLNFSTLGSRADASQHRFGGTVTVVSETEGNDMAISPALLLHKRVDAGSAGMGLAKIQWRMTNDAGTQNIDAGRISAQIVNATDGSESALIGITPMRNGVENAVAIQFYDGVSIPGGSLGGGAFRGQGSLALTDVLWVGTNRVLTERQTGWNAPTGMLLRGTFDSATATPTQTAQTLAALLTDLRAHGLIGS